MQYILLATKSFRLISEAPSWTSWNLGTPAPWPHACWPCPRRPAAWLRHQLLRPRHALRQGRNAWMNEGMDERTYETGNCCVCVYVFVGTRALLCSLHVSLHQHEPTTHTVNRISMNGGFVLSGKYFFGAPRSYHRGSIRGVTALVRKFFAQSRYLTANELQVKITLNPKTLKFRGPETIECYTFTAQVTWLFGWCAQGKIGPQLQAASHTKPNGSFRK